MNFRIKEKLLKVQVETGESYPVRTLAELLEKFLQTGAIDSEPK